MRKRPNFRPKSIVGAALFSLLGAGCGPRTHSRPWPPARPGYSSPIAAENALPGDPTWSTGPDATRREIEGYADRISARAGETAQVMASADSAHQATWALYRLGWYGGAGARLVAAGGPFAVSPQPTCPMDPSTGLVQCAWSPSFQIDLPGDAVSGLYAVKLVRDDGLTSFVPLVVTDERPADLLMQASVNTWQAYNLWGGASYYRDLTGTLPRGRALAVSFDRPYAMGRGAGTMLRYEAVFARFLERYRYDVSYTTNAEVSALGAGRLYRAGAFLPVGHDEYWTGQERDAVEHGRDQGVPLLFIGANNAYWKVRYDGPAQPNPRVMWCYRDARADPVQGAEVTGLFRGKVIDRPENSLIGVMYRGWLRLSFPLVVASAESWLYRGTALQDGDALPALVGYEYDGIYANHRQPAGLSVLASSPVVDVAGVPGAAQTVAYRTDSGTLVFATGTLDWISAVDGPARDPRVERMTANALREALGLAVPKALESPGPLPAPPTNGPFAASVYTVASGIDRPTGVAVLAGGGLAVSDATGRVYRLGPAPTRSVTLVAGGGTAIDPRGAPGLLVQLQTPTGLAATASGDLYVADSSTHAILKVANDAQNTAVAFAGQVGQPGYADGARGSSRFCAPGGLSLDEPRQRLLVADTCNHRVRAVDLASGTVTTLAGSVAGNADGPGATARFHFPTAVAAAPDGRVFVVSGNASVKVILPDAASTVVTLAGGRQGYADGTGDQAKLAPLDAVWAGNELVVADTANLRLRGVSPGATAAATQVWTLAGSGRSGGADGTGDQAEMALPMALAAAPDGTIYVADAANGAIRAVRR